MPSREDLGLVLPNGSEAVLDAPPDRLRYVGRYRREGREGSADPGGQVWLPRPTARRGLFIQYLKWTPKRLQTVMGHSSVTMTFDLYGHLFGDIEADKADMAKIEAAVRAA